MTSSTLMTSYLFFIGAPGIIPEDDVDARGDDSTETDIPLTIDIPELMINSLC